MLVCLADAADHDGVCRTLPVSQLARMCALDARHVRRLLSGLVRDGLLSRQDQPGKPTVWRIAGVGDGGAGESAPPVSQTPVSQTPGPGVTPVSQTRGLGAPPERDLESLPLLNLSINTTKYKAATEAYEREIGLLTQAVSDELRAAVDRYGSEWVADAIRQAARRNARSWAYAAAVLAGWERDGRGAPVERGQTRRRGRAPATTPAALTPEQVAELNRRLAGE